MTNVRSVLRSLYDVYCEYFASDYTTMYDKLLPYVSLNFLTEAELLCAVPNGSIIGVQRKQ